MKLILLFTLTCLTLSAKQERPNQPDKVTELTLHTSPKQPFTVGLATQLAASKPHLETLHLTGFHIEREATKMLSSFKQLRSLTIITNRGLDDGLFKSIGKLVHLREIILDLE